MVTIKSSINRMTFAAENFKVRNLVAIYKKNNLIMRNSSERSELGNFLMVLLHI